MADRANAQQQASNSSVAPDEFWPEVDFYQRLSDNARLMARASGVIGDGQVSNQQYGLNLDLFLKPRPFQAYVLGAQSLVEDRHLLATLRLGYRYSTSPAEDGEPNVVQNRLLTELTLRYHLWSILATDRNGFDWRWTNGTYSTRYRNRLQLEHTATIGTYEVTPYASAEVIYLLSGGYWNQIRYRAGVQLPIVPHFSVQVYYGYDHVWHPNPANVDALGLTLIISY
jgi:hypothetical protein